MNRNHRLFIPFKGHKFTRMALMILGIISVCSVPLWLNTYDKETEIEIVFKPQTTQINPYQKEYEELLYPTVRITAGFGTGSGVIFETTDSHRLTQIFILTACHVVDKENTVNIELYNSIIITGTVVITDTVKDLALIKPQINTDFTDKIYTAQLSPKDYTPYIFAPIYTVGCSLGLHPRPSQGIISVIEQDHWEVTSPVLPGNSGGPVYDAHTYEVIGIAVWVKVYDYQLITTMAGIVPINQIYEFLQPQITQIDTDKHK